MSNRFNANGSNTSSRKARRSHATTSYEANENGMFLVRETEDSSGNTSKHYQQLSNFTAKVVAELTVTDGLDERRDFEIEAEVAGSKTKVTVTLPAERVERMDWVLERLGATAIVYPGHMFKDHLRAAILEHSAGITRVTVFKHVGWVVHEGRRGYLHAGGIIWAEPQAERAGTPADRTTPNCNEDERLHSAGPNGPISEQTKSVQRTVHVDLAGPLQKFHLPEPVAGKERLVAVRASLKILELAADEIILPLYALVWRSVLGGVSFGAWIDGTTGNGKTTIAALLQQHFGPELDAENLPGSWIATTNSLEATAFFAKDVVFVVDDWVERGSRGEIERANMNADRLIRSAGNQCGRSRLSRDGTPIEGKPPRGLIISTGESTPAGASLNARLLRVEMNDTVITQENNWLLSGLQHAAAKGYLATAMASYISWLAPQFDQLHSEFEQQRDIFRRDIFSTVCVHARTATICADIVAGFEPFLEFCLAYNVITAAEFDDIWERLHAALFTLIDKQNRQQEFTNPASGFLSLLCGVLQSRRAHLEFTGGGVPDDSPSAWGWEVTAWTEDDPSSTDGGLVRRSRNTPKGHRIGWVDHTMAYLLIEPALAEVQRLANTFGLNLPLNERTLGRALYEAGFLAETDLEKRNKYTRRKSIGGQRLNVLCMLTATVYDNTADVDESSVFDGDFEAIMEA